jgi:ABC-type arginine transport system permease subunit
VMPAVVRLLVLPIVLGVAIALVAAGSYWGLEALLASYTDHARGLWEGAVVVTIMNGGNALAHRVLRRVDAKIAHRIRLRAEAQKKEDPS